MHHVFRADSSLQKREFTAIRKRGYALEREEAVGAVGIAGPRLLRRGRESTVAAAVLEAARGISRELGAARRWPAT